ERGEEGESEGLAMEVHGCLGRGKTPRSLGGEYFVAVTVLCAPRGVRLGTRPARPSPHARRIDDGLVAIRPEASCPGNGTGRGSRSAGSRACAPCRCSG